ncbi:DUF2935 domain-containing protein [Paenibacillus caseinilyticus]|uniref:DUF2935 domain-containing protein n=1 Tax=Paenibacillus mucilaginosus K02 TaxID=997761 RepID=I0BF07_9BACL|nr:DUF2935 domain-containing protein [Paenibacillus mucilaginosus]AFH60954.1 hypothetical protein B2K_09510 [Paenibacillus mucilaginosus K02]
MKGSGFVRSALFEHRFWLQVLGDHARFIKGGLSADEKVELERAEGFIRLMDDLLAQARGELAEEALLELTREAGHAAQELRAFKLHLLERHLTGRIGLSLSPSFLNHMVNELEEYLRVLSYLSAGRPAPVWGELHHHLVWLQDAYGHAASIAGEMDMAETKLIDMAKTFDKHFRDYYLKAVELAGYMRTRLKEFPALARLNKEVELEMVLFRQFLSELEEMRLSKEALGTLTPLMADHMAREECYYLVKLSETADVKPPGCDPTKERTEG